MIELFNPAPVFLEINPDSLRGLREGGGLELPLQRAPDGRLTDACRKDLIPALQSFLGHRKWRMPVRAVCGVSGHGVSLRKIPLPSAPGGDLEGVVRLQIEKEFPLPPDELAWGWLAVSGPAGPRAAVVVAVRKQVIEDYAAVLAEAGAHPEFTLSAFARELLCPSPGEPHGWLEVGRNGAELAWFENGVAAGVKILRPNGDLAGVVLKHAPPGVLYVSGPAAILPEFWEPLNTRLKCHRLDFPGGEGVSAATLGLKKSVSENVPLPRLRVKPPPGRTAFGISRVDLARIENRRWLARAAALLALLVILPYAEAVLLKPLLAWKLAAVKSQQQQFASVVGPELHFLQSLKQGQPPYLDAMYLFSKAASPGVHFDSLSLNQHGDITLKASMPGAQQVMDFRARLIASGFFSSITVEEQTPVPNQPKVNVRMTAQWKPAAARAGLQIAPAPAVLSPTNSQANAPAPPVAAPAPQG